MKTHLVFRNAALVDENASDSNPVGKKLAAETTVLAGDQFTAADISVTYALEFAQRTGNAVLDATELAYVARTSGRDAYRRAMDTCHATRAWAAEVAGQRDSADAAK